MPKHARSSGSADGLPLTPTDAFGLEQQLDHAGHRGRVRVIEHALHGVELLPDERNAQTRQGREQTATQDGVDALTEPGS